MGIKKINKILCSVSAALSFMLFMGTVSMPVYANEVNTVNTDSTSLQTEEKNDYSEVINKTVEKDGFKITFKSITATKHKIQVVTTVQNKESYDKDSFYNSIFMVTAKGVDCRSRQIENKKIDDKTKEIKFELESKDGFPENIELRIDILLPHYDLNAWIKDNVNLTKNFNKEIEKDVSLNVGRYKVNKFVSDVLGTFIYCNDIRNDDDLWDSESKLLLKCDDKLYELTQKGSFFRQDGVKGMVRGLSTAYLTYDDIKDGKEVSLIPIKCNITNDEAESIFEEEKDYSEEEDSLDENKVKYNKNYLSGEGENKISKIDRSNDKVKVYCKGDSEKNSLLMAAGLRGCYEHKKDEEFINSNSIKKVIYKDNNEEYGYVVEFDNVLKDKTFCIDEDFVIYKNLERFELENEMKIN